MMKRNYFAHPANVNMSRRMSSRLNEMVKSSKTSHAYKENAVCPSFHSLYELVIVLLKCQVVLIEKHLTITAGSGPERHAPLAATKRFQLLSQPRQNKGGMACMLLPS